LPLDDHHLAISHVVNDHLTRGASRALDDLDCFLAGRASGTEHFDLSLGSHLSTPVCLGSVAANRWWCRITLGGSSQVKHSIRAAPLSPLDIAFWRWPGCPLWVIFVRIGTLRMLTGRPLRSESGHAHACLEISA